METFTKESLINRLNEIREMGWVANRRPGNAGGVGNTLEDLLGIEENNLPIPNAAEWELKCQRSNTSSLLTLFHMEPSPTAIKFVPKILLPKYGWEHKEAGGKYSIDEKSFRQTISGLNRSNRGFKVIVDRFQRKVLVSFDYSFVDPNHNDWLDEVINKAGKSELDPQPYWGFDDLMYKAGSKLKNCFYIVADRKRENHQEYYSYSKILILRGFRLDGLLEGIEKGYFFIDFDARTGHNHGTKFRIKSNHIPNLYKSVTEI